MKEVIILYILQILQNIIQKYYLNIYSNIYTCFCKMDKFLARYKLLKHTQEEISNLNSTTPMRDIEFLV